MVSARTTKALVVSLIVAILGGLIAFCGSHNSYTLNHTPRGREVGDVESAINNTNTGNEGRFSIYTLAVIVAFGVQWLAFIPAWIWKTEKFYDLFGGGTYFTITAALFGAVPYDVASSPRCIVIGVCIMIWALRLAAFLFIRVMQSGKDDRFDEFKDNAFAFFNLWHIQGLWITLTASAGWMAMTSYDVGGTEAFTDGPDSRQSAGWLIAGLIMWVIGFAFEFIADLQKMQFKKNPSNKGKFIRSGLWGISRHPNYFGEILLWAGIAVMSIPALRGWQYASLISPVFVSLLLCFVSGLPMLEAKADTTWGGQPDYEAYKRSTGILVPFVTCFCNNGGGGEEGEVRAANANTSSGAAPSKNVPLTEGVEAV